MPAEPGIGFSTRVFAESYEVRKLRVCPHIALCTNNVPVPISHRGKARAPADALENPTTLGARPSPAALAGRPIGGPVSITQTWHPNLYRLGNDRNARAPAGRWKTQRRRERGRPRLHQPDARSYDRFQ
ncbi:MAG: hypothetical protein GX456_09190 [Verrucomicrobia bacterium]|nr:hypothetical protein [Verrucomicrobiota bacterium]